MLSYHFHNERTSLPYWNDIISLSQRQDLSSLPECYYIISAMRGLAFDAGMQRSLDAGAYPSTCGTARLATPGGLALAPQWLQCNGSLPVTVKILRGPQSGIFQLKFSWGHKVAYNSPTKKSLAFSPSNPYRGNATARLRRASPAGATGGRHRQASPTAPPGVPPPQEPFPCSPPSSPSFLLW